jgi:CheY-like chemotaxis protein
LLKHQEIKTGNLLIVDDEECLTSPLKLILDSAGYKVTICNNGKDAIEIYSKHHTNIDLILLDFNLPGMNGYDILLAMLGIDAQAKFLLCSGEDLEERFPTKNNAVLGVMQKPFSSQVLIQTISTAIAKSCKKKVKSPDKECRMENNELTPYGQKEGEEQYSQEFINETIKYLSKFLPDFEKDSFKIGESIFNVPETVLKGWYKKHILALSEKNRAVWIEIEKISIAYKEKKVTPEMLASLKKLTRDFGAMADV